MAKLDEDREMLDLVHEKYYRWKKMPTMSASGVATSGNGGDVTRCHLPEARNASRVLRVADRTRSA